MLGTLIALVLVVFLVVYGLSNPGSSETGKCLEQCALQNKTGRLVPSFKGTPAKSGGYVGPWRCECQ